MKASEREETQVASERSAGDRYMQLELDKFVNLDEIPDPIIELIDQCPFVIGGESDVELDHIQTGVCVCCKRPLGESTMISVYGEGISSIVCSGPCHDDLMIVGYLHEQMRDLIERVEMRQNLTERHD